MNQIASNFLSSAEPTKVLDDDWMYFDESVEACTPERAVQRYRVNSLFFHSQRRRLIPFELDGWRIRRSRWKTTSFVRYEQGGTITFKRPHDYRAA